MYSFSMNGYPWKAIFVKPNDPMLVDRTGALTVATTDPNTLTIYISKTISGSFLTRVLIHELGHCAIYSFGLMDDIHKMCYPEYWVEAEEWVCNFIADYGMAIYRSAYDILGTEAFNVIPIEIERFIA